VQGGGREGERKGGREEGRDGGREGGRETETETERMREGGGREKWLVGGPIHQANPLRALEHYIYIRRLRSLLSSIKKMKTVALIHQED